MELTEYDAEIGPGGIVYGATPSGKRSTATVNGYRVRLMGPERLRIVREWLNATDLPGDPEFSTWTPVAAMSYLIERATPAPEWEPGYYKITHPGSHPGSSVWCHLVERRGDEWIIPHTGEVLAVGSSATIERLTLADDDHE